MTIFPHEIKGKMSKLPIKSAHTVSPLDTLPIHESFWIRPLLRKIKNEIQELIITSGVPQNVLVVPMPSIPSLHKPKSVSVI